MRIRYVAPLAIACALAVPARAELDFEWRNADRLGIAPELEAAWQGCAAQGSFTWLWGIRGWQDPTGKYLYGNRHRRCGDVPGGWAWKMDEATGTFSLETIPPNGQYGPPRETRPIVWSLYPGSDNASDLIHTGDETRGIAGTAVNNGSTWSVLPGFDFLDNTGAQVIRYLSDGRTMVEGWARMPNPDGSGAVRGQAVWRKQVFDPTTSQWETTEEIPAAVADPAAPQMLPADAPQSVRDLMLASNERWTFPIIKEFGDCYVVTRTGGYGGQEQRWYRLVCNGQDVTTLRGLTGNGDVISTDDIDGDGLRDLVVFREGVSDRGLWRQQVDGTFTQDTTGVLSTLNADLRVASYVPTIYSEDLDGDGDPDMVFTNHRNGKTVVYENDAGVFSIYATLKGADGYHVDVFEYDGVKHLAIAGPGADPDTQSGSQNYQQAGIFWNLSTNGAPPPPPPPLPDPTPQECVEEALLQLEVQRLNAAQIAGVGQDSAAMQASLAAMRDTITQAENCGPFQ